jgi:hypothetical protein
MGGARTCSGPEGRFPCNGRTADWVTPEFPNPAVAGVAPLRRSIAWYFETMYVRMEWIAALGMVGLIALALDPARPRAAGWVLAMLIGYFTLVPALTNWPLDRYRVPVDPLLFLFAMWGARSLLRVKE